MISVRWGTTPQLNIFYKSAIDRKLDVVRHNYRFCLPRTNLMHVTQCMSRPFQCDLYSNIQQLLSTQYFQWDDQTCLRSSPGNSRGEPGADRWSWNEALRLTKAQVHTSTQVHTRRAAPRIKAGVPFEPSTWGPPTDLPSYSLSGWFLGAMCPGSIWLAITIETSSP